MFPVPARFIFGARLSFLWLVIKKVETKKKEKNRGHFQHQLFYNPTKQTLLFIEQSIY